MKLDRYKKSAFVCAVIADIPKVDYAEQARSLVSAWEVSQIPDAVKKLLETHPDWVRKPTPLQMPAGLYNMAVLTVVGYSGLEGAAPELWAKLIEIGKKANEQKANTKRVEDATRNTIRTFTTVEAARKGLPECFHKYLIEVTGLTPDLPAVDLAKELTDLGWPK